MPVASSIFNARGAEPNAVADAARERRLPLRRARYDERCRQYRFLGVRLSQTKPGAETLWIVVLRQPPPRRGTRKNVLPAAPVAARAEK